MPAPRGTAIQIGNLPGARTVSAKAQLDATAARLRAAEASGDPNEMLAALQASTSLDLPDGVAMTPELQKLTATMRQRIGAEPELRALDALRRSRAVKTKVRRLWELMVSESAQIEMSEGRTPTVAGPGEEDTVTRTGYMALHIRVAKTLIAASDFNREEAEGISDSDWAEDISKFSGTSHIMVWLDEIRTKFKEAAAQAVALHGFTGLFARCELQHSLDLILIAVPANQTRTAIRRHGRQRRARHGGVLRRRTERPRHRRRHYHRHGAREPLQAGRCRRRRGS